MNKRDPRGREPRQTDRKERLILVVGNVEVPSGGTDSDVDLFEASQPVCAAKAKSPEGVLGRTSQGERRTGDQGESESARGCVQCRNRKEAALLSSVAVEARRIRGPGDASGMRVHPRSDEMVVVVCVVCESVCVRVCAVEV